MSLHDIILKAVVGWAKSTARVSAVYAYGSFARSEHTPASDLDVAILTNDRLMPADLDALRAAMPFPISWHHEEQEKAVIYIGDTLFKLDLVFCDDASGLPQRISHGGPQNPHLRVIYQKSPAYPPPGVDGAYADDVPDFTAFSAEGFKFVAYFEAASRYHRRSDGFLFYFHYNLALTCLARMFALLESKGSANHLYAPRNLLSHLGGSRHAEAKSWHALQGVLYLPDAHASKQRLVAKFSELLERAAGMGINLPIGLKSASTFISKILARDFFFNLRDFAFAYGSSVNRGVLFRGPTITRWQGSKELSRFLDINNIRLIIDFREDSEIRKDGGRLSYDPATLVGRSYVNIPIGDAAAVKQDGKSSYANSFINNTAAYVQAYKRLANGEGSCLVHCHAGKDRTGIFCAMLGRMLGLPRDAIVHDYLLSEQGVVSSTVSNLLEEIENLGGPAALLKDAGLDDADLAHLRAKLLA